MECENCKNEFRIQSIEKEIENNSKQHKEFYGKFEDSGKSQVRFEENIKQILDAVKEIKNDIIDIKNKPNRRWELVVAAAITATITSLIATFISKMLMK